MSSHVGDRLSPFMDGELTPEERGAVEAHLRDCAECARELADLAEVEAMARELPLAAPDGYFESFPARVRDRLRARPASRTWRNWTWAAAAALLLAVLTPLTLMEKRKEAAAPAQAPATYPGPTVMAEVAQQPPPAATAMPEATAPRANRADDELRALEPADSRGEKLGAAREKQQELAAAKTAAAPSLPAAPAPRPAATSPPPAGGFAAPPAEAGSDAPPPAAELRLRKPKPPVSTGSEQHGPRAQAQAPSSTQEQRDGFAQDTGVAKAKPEPGRQAVAEEKRRDAQRELEDASKREENFERDLKKKDVDADGKAESTFGYAVSGDASAGEVALYRSLSARSVSSVQAARGLRDAWRGFLRTYPQSPWADQARVQIIEASLAAWRLGGDPADREAARRDADAYLPRADAMQKERVRALRSKIER